MTARPTRLNRGSLDRLLRLRRPDNKVVRATPRMEDEALVGSNPYEAPQCFPTDDFGPRSLQRCRPSLAELATLLLLVVSALPFALLSSLYFFAVRAAFYLGHWPYYGHPDPKDLPPDLPCEWLKYAGPPAVLALQVVASRPLVGRCRDYGGRLLLAFAMFPASLMLCFALLVSDPVGVLDWFMD